MLVGCGVAVVVVQEPRPDVVGLYLLGAGAGAAVGVVLARDGGFAVGPLWDWP